MPASVKKNPTRNQPRARGDPAPFAGTRAGFAALLPLLLTGPPACGTDPRRYGRSPADLGPVYRGHRARQHRPGSVPAARHRPQPHHHRPVGVDPSRHGGCHLAATTVGAGRRERSRAAVGGCSRITGRLRRHNPSCLGLWPAGRSAAGTGPPRPPRRTSLRRREGRHVLPVPCVRPAVGLCVGPRRPQRAAPRHLRFEDARIDDPRRGGVGQCNGDALTNIFNY